MSDGHDGVGKHNPDLLLAMPLRSLDDAKDAESMLFMFSGIIRGVVNQCEQENWSEERLQRHLKLATKLIGLALGFC